MNYNHQFTFRTVQTDSSSFCPGVFVQKIPGTQIAAKNHKKTHKISPGHMVPGWSGSVPVQLIFFNSYILNTFLYDKN